MAQSWFADPELLTTNLSASYLPGNLSKLDDTVVYAHVDDVVVANVAQSPCVAVKLPIAEKSCIHQVRLCALNGTAFIVAASDNGVQIFDANGEQSVFELALKDALDTPEDGAAVFCRGIAAVNAKRATLIVGTSVGKLLVIGPDTSSKSSATTPEFELLETLGAQHKDAAIMWLESSLGDKPLVASSDDAGLLLVLNPDDDFSVVHRIASNTGYPITAMCFVSDYALVCGDVTGTLRIFIRREENNCFQLFADVAAHTRAVTALDVYGDNVASVSEDAYLNVWDLAGVKTKAKASSSGKRVQLMSSHIVPNDLLTGVAFAGAKRIVTAAYDTNHLKLWVPE